MALFPTDSYLDYNPPWHPFNGSPELASNCTSVSSSREASPLTEARKIDCLEANLSELSESCKDERHYEQGMTAGIGGSDRSSGGSKKPSSKSKSKSRAGSSNIKSPVGPTDVFNAITLDVYGEEQTILSGSLQSNNAIQSELIGSACKRIVSDPNRREDHDNPMSNYDFLVSSGQDSNETSNDRTRSSISSKSSCHGLFPPISNSQFDKSKAIPLLPDFSEDQRTSSTDSRGGYK